MNESFIFLEISITVLFILCVLHSIKRGKNYLFELIIISIYGLLLEIIGVALVQSYIYGDFLVKILDAPVAVALGWGVIIYTSMATAERLGSVQKIRPFLVALLVVNIDLSMDAIAIREGFWAWGGSNGFWFNVPASNFICWFVAAFSFSYFIYYFRKNQKLKTFYPILCLILSLITLIIVEIIMIYWLLPAIRNPFYTFVLVVYILDLSLIYVIMKKGQLKKDNELDWIVISIPTGFHLFFLVLLLVRDYKTPELIIVSVSMTIIGLYAHLLPSISALRKNIEQNLPDLK